MTRMWMGNPKTMCRQHLLGEHKEIHQFVGTLKKKMRIQGYIDNNCVEIESIVKRHGELVSEMKSRGYNHNSPIPSEDEIKDMVCYLEESQIKYKIDVKSSDKERFRRCNKCKELKNEIDSD